MIWRCSYCRTVKGEDYREPFGVFIDGICTECARALTEVYRLSAGDKPRQKEVTGLANEQTRAGGG